LSLNYRPVFRDRFDVSSANARASFVKQVQKKNLRLDSAVVERMLEALALVVKSDGNGPIVPDDGDVVSIGSKTAIVRPEGIFLVDDKGERQVSNFSLIFTRTRPSTTASRKPGCCAARYVSKATFCPSP